MKKILWILIIGIVLLVGYIGVHFASAYRTIVVERPTSFLKSLCLFHCGSKGNEAGDPNPIPTADPNHLNVLVLGIRGEDDIANGGLLTDTIMVMSVDKSTKKAVMVSLPRDLYIDMTGRLTDGTSITLRGKLNEVYVHGLEHGEGLTLTSQIISRISGIPIDRAVLFDFQAFGKIIDILGGVDVHLDRPFSEKQQWGYEFSLPAGDNHLNSEQALYYVRSRYSSSDFDRARRQQQVMVAIKSKAFSLGILKDPRKITAIIDGLKGNLKTNFQPWEFNDLMSIATSLKGDNLYHAVLTTENLLYETHLPSGEYVLLPRGDNYTGIRDYFKHIFEHPALPTPTPSQKLTPTHS